MYTFESEFTKYKIYVLVEKLLCILYFGDCYFYYCKNSQRTGLPSAKKKYSKGLGMVNILCDTIQSKINREHMSRKTSVDKTPRIEIIDTYIGATTFPSSKQQRKTKNTHF